MEEGPLSTMGRLFSFLPARWPALVIATAIGACAPLPSPGGAEKIPPSGDLVFIRGGTFTMGDWTGEGTPKERPAREVTVSDFFLGRREVTAGEYRLFVEATGYRTAAEEAGWVFEINPAMNRFEKRAGVSWKNPGFPQADEGPVVWVNWNDARAYTDWLAARTGRPYRLPTEAEWEFAAREGGRDLRWAGTSDPERVGEFAWFAGNSAGRPHAVAEKAPNGLGLHDMSGNVWEWCLDWTERYGSAPGPLRDPRGPVASPYRALRGGSWRVGSATVRTTYRNGYRTDYAHSSIGFRVALPAGE